MFGPCFVMQYLMSFLVAFYTIQISVTFLFSFNFNQVCGRLDGLIRACISYSLDFNVAFPARMFYLSKVVLLGN